MNKDVAKYQRSELDQELDELKIKKAEALRSYKQQLNAEYNLTSKALRDQRARLTRYINGEELRDLLLGLVEIRNQIKRGSHFYRTDFVYYQLPGFDKPAELCMLMELSGGLSGNIWEHAFRIGQKSGKRWPKEVVIKATDYENAVQSLEELIEEIRTSPIDVLKKKWLSD